jgi:hypothetical protein
MQLISASDGATASGRSCCKRTSLNKDKGGLIALVVDDDDDDDDRDDDDEEEEKEEEDRSRWVNRLDFVTVTIEVEEDRKIKLSMLDIVLIGARECSLGYTAPPQLLCVDTARFRDQLEIGKVGLETGGC